MVNALFSIFGAVSNVVIVGGLFLLIFAIMGVSFFKGKYFSCVELPDDIDEDIIVYQEDCEKYGG